MNERITENIVRKLLREMGYLNNEDIIVEEQKSQHPVIDKLLKTASKRGSGSGHPEFIIRSKSISDFIIVIECKADTKQHQSKGLNKYADYAVDGVLLYSSYLSKEYDVLAIAVSGQDEKYLRISHFLYLNGGDKHHDFKGSEILPFNDYFEAFRKSDIKFQQDYNKLLEYTKELNNKLHSKKIKEAQRSLLISGILIAVQNRSFKSGYKLHSTARQLANHLLSTIVSEFRSANLKEENANNLEQAFSFIKTHTTLNTDKTFFENLITDIDQNINNFIKTYKFFDTLGQFYIEFLRYANNDKGLGIVLTPPHITELFVDLAETNKNSIVYDNCCGTAGFLISAMKKMVQDANGNESKIEDIKRHQLIGVEYQDDIYALSVSNMVIHGDGKTNVIRGDCFDLTKEIKEQFSPSVGLLNPPYKTKPEDAEELDFVLDNLQTLKQGGKCVAIVPMSCALALSGETYDRKKMLLEKHTLEAVMSMPEELFHNSKVNVVTCAMVFSAHIPHPKGKKTWLGYWRNDGFKKIKYRGRIDIDNQWPKIKKEWLENYFNKEVVSEKSLMRELSADEEWCIEAYMKSDYSILSEDNFKVTALDYLSHCIYKEDLSSAKNFETKSIDTKLDVNDWVYYEVDSLFNITLGKPIHRNKLAQPSERYRPNYIAYVTRTTGNNGVELFIDPETIESRAIQKNNAITIGAEGFQAFYQRGRFITGNKVNVLRNEKLNEFNALFICAILNLEIKKKFNYGRGLVKSRLEKMTIKLPAKKDEPDYQYMEDFIKSISFTPKSI